jgi:sodium transport system permease protein
VPILSAISAEIKPIFNLVATDIATEEDVSMFALKMVLPMLIMTMLLSGCLAVAPESIAGEKERGTIATILITPIKRSFIAIGKVIALSITALSSAIVSFLGLVFSLPKLASSAGGVEMSLNFNFSFLDYLSLFVVILVTVMSFTIILSIISTFAKSVKEATSYALPVMILVIVIGLSGMLIGETTSELMCLIPIYSTVQCIRAVFSQTITPLMVIFTVVSDLVLIGVGVYVMTKLFSSERVMFSK